MSLFEKNPDEIKRELKKIDAGVTKLLDRKFKKLQEEARDFSEAITNFVSSPVLG